MSAVPVQALDAMPPQVHEMFARRGINADRVAALIDLGPQDMLLLAGSYATGEANATSDLDFLVLCESDDHSVPVGSSNHPSIFGDSFDIQVNDLTVNLEYVNKRWFEALCAAVDRARSCADEPMICNFEALEFRLAQRVSIGIPLHGAERLGKVRGRLDMGIVHASAAALNFLMAMSLLEDTTALAPPSRELMLRGAGESLVLAAINAVGPITYDIKHIFRRAARLAAEPGAPAVLAHAEAVVFAERLPYPKSADLVLDHAVDLNEVLSGDPAHAGIAAMLHSFRPSWAWTGRPFD